MEFTVRDWMMDLVVYVDPNTPVTDALETMRRRYINSVIVSKTEDNPEYGILTSTDICDKIVAQDRNPALVKTREVMTSPLITVSANMGMPECARLMKKHNIHHLPVADEHGTLIGLISATDLFVAAEERGWGRDR